MQQIPIKLKIIGIIHSPYKTIKDVPRKCRKETSEIEIVDNPAVQARGGAGIQAVQFLVSQNVNAVIAPEIGPNAFKVLRGSSTKIYKGFKTSAKELIEKWKNNELEEI